MIEIPEYFSACSHIVVWWKCEKGHEWSSPISRRTNGNSKCPYCTGRYADSNNNLLISYPNIAKEWHPFKNKIRPENLTPHSNIHIWWKCINDHEWFASIDNRTKINGTNCPICAKETTIKTRISNLILNGNSLSSKFPNLSNEWHPSKNFNLHPTDVTPGCNKKVWWKCSNCGYSWLATINNRTNKNSGCPKCSRRSEIYV